MVAKIIVLVIFFAVMVFIGIANRKRSRDVNGFLLGGRGCGAVAYGFAYGTSYFSAVIFIGYAGQFGWKYGVASTWIGLGNAFIGSLLAWLVLGRRSASCLSTSTARQCLIFGKRYDSKALRTMAAAIIFVFLIPYTASLYNGLSRLFAVAFNVDYTVMIVIMALLTCVYVVAGGYKATAVTDFIQGIIMLVGISAVVIAVLNTNGGFTGSRQRWHR